MVARVLLTLESEFFEIKCQILFSGRKSYICDYKVARKRRESENGRSEWGRLAPVSRD